MKKLMLIFLCLSLLSCSNNTIKIGFSADLTSILAEEGTATRNGFLLAIEEINDKGGILGQQIEPNIKDDQSNLDIAYTINETFQSEETNFIIGYFISSMEPAIREGMDNYNHLYISPTMATGNLSGENDDFYRVIGDNHIMAHSLYELISETKTERILIVQDISNRPLTQVLKDDLIEYFSKSNTSYVGLFELDDTPDYNALIEYAIQTQAEGLVLLTSSVRAAEILQRTQVAELKTTNFVSTWALSSELISKAGQAAEGLLAVGFYDSNSEAQSIVDFRDKYVHRFNQAPTSTSILAYDAVYLLKSALEQANATDIDRVKKAIKRIDSFNGVTGEFTIDEYGDAIRPYKWLMIEDGQIKAYK